MIQQVTSRYPKILNTGTEISTCTQKSHSSPIFNSSKVETIQMFSNG